MRLAIKPLLLLTITAFGCMHGAYHREPRAPSTAAKAAARTAAERCHPAGAWRVTYGSEHVSGAPVCLERATGVGEATPDWLISISRDGERWIVLENQGEVATKDGELGADCTLVWTHFDYETSGQWKGSTVQGTFGLSFSDDNLVLRIEALSYWPDAPNIPCLFTHYGKGTRINSAE